MPYNPPPTSPKPEPSPPPPPSGLMRRAGARASNVVERDPTTPGPLREAGVDPCPRPLERVIEQVVWVAALGSVIVYTLAQLLGH